MPCVGSICVTVPTPGSVLASVAGDAFTSMAHAWADSANQAVSFLVSGWTRISTPTVAQGPTSWLTGQVRDVTTFIAVLSLVIAAGTLSWRSWRRGGSDALARATGGIIRFVIVGGAGVAAINLLLAAGDAFSNSVLSSAVPDGNFGKLANLSAASILTPGLLMILAIVALLGSIIQILLLLVRSGLLVVLAALWPAAAAASITEAGSGMWKKTTGWLLALILFKPAAAVLYAVAFRMTLDGSNGLDQVTGALLLAMAVLALPALLRLIVPAVAAIGGASAGTVAAGGAALATGAISMGRSARGAGSAGSAGAAPAGATAPPSGASSNGSGPAGAPGASPAPVGSAAGSAGAGAGAAGGAAGGAAAAGPAAPAVLAAAAAAKGLGAAARGATNATEGKES